MARHGRQHGTARQGGTAEANLMTFLMRPRLALSWRIETDVRVETDVRREYSREGAKVSVDEWVLLRLIGRQ
jgi:hypothetical protein